MKEQQGYKKKYFKINSANNKCFKIALKTKHYSDRFFYVFKLF